MTKYFEDVELVRMSNGDYCLVRPLGLVPGGKGMKHHVNLLRLTPSGISSKLWSLVWQRARAGAAAIASAGETRREPTTFL
ncbi:MAG: hypothetical protein WC670_16785 [Pseudolabrys sp.]